jgi:hypothetical protein
MHIHVSRQYYTLLHTHTLLFPLPLMEYYHTHNTHTHIHTLLILSRQHYWYNNIIITTLHIVITNKYQYITLHILILLYTPFFHNILPIYKTSIHYINITITHITNIKNVITGHWIILSKEHINNEGQCNYTSLSTQSTSNVHIISHIYIHTYTYYIYIYDHITYTQYILLLLLHTVFIIVQSSLLLHTHT